ncbi:MAG: hypothetical protein LBO72_10320, partial [Helicobacteraceae bacterium]|jgi:hypothetical protein|nr:hypothetical protein [Helicobacteraceae bacterium]
MIGATRADEKTYLQFNFHGDYRIAEGLKAEAALVTGKFGDFGGDVRSQTKVGLGARYIF